MATVTPGWHYLKRRRGMRVLGFLDSLGPFWYPTTPVVVTEDVNYLRGLDTLLSAADANISVEAHSNGDSDWRIDGTMTSVDDILQACRLADLAVTPIEAGVYGLNLLHEDGLTAAEIDSQVNGGADAITAITGVRPVSFAYPYHLHTTGLMEKLAADGWLGARDGDPHGTGSGEPFAGFLNGIHGTAAWRESWLTFLPFEMTTHGGLTEAVLQATTDAADMDDLIFDTVSHGVISATFCYTYASLAALWKAKNTAVQVYVHGSAGDPTDLDTDRLGWLMDALIADGGFWITSFGELMEYMRTYHAPDATGLVWTPTSTPVGPYPGGKAAAFVFSTDDGNARNADYDVVMAAKGDLHWTAFVNPGTIDDANKLTAVQLAALSAGGLCEVGCHTTDHTKLVRVEACKITNASASPKALGIVDNGGATRTKTITIYDQTLDSPLDLPEAFRYLDADSVDVGNGAAVVTWRDLSLAGELFSTVTVSPTMISSWTNGLPALNFAGGAGEYMTGAALNWHSNTDGFILGFVGTWATSSARTPISKYNTNVGLRYWFFRPGRDIGISEDSNTNAIQSATYSGLTSNTPAICLLAWTPGAVGEHYVNGAKVGETVVLGAPTAINHIDLDTGAAMPVCIGTNRLGADNYFVGKIGSIFCVKKNTEAYRLALNKWASARWGIALA